MNITDMGRTACWQLVDEKLPSCNDGLKHSVCSRLTQLLWSHAHDSEEIDDELLDNIIHSLAVCYSEGAMQACNDLRKATHEVSDYRMYRY